MRSTPIFSQITAVKDTKYACHDFKCHANGFCIHPDLLCDGVNHCPDGSDESDGAAKQGSERERERENTFHFLRFGAGMGMRIKT